MIIQCQQCQTRFKVGDDKLANGPIRVRCSKCNHVFMASKDASAPPLPQPRSNDLPPTSVISLPPKPADASKPGPVTAMFAAFDIPNTGPPSSGSGGGFASPQNRSGIFRAPSSSTLPGVGSAPPTTAPPTSAQPPPVPAPTPAPFSPPGFGAPPRSAPGLGAAPTDPFANVETVAAKPARPEPFAMPPTQSDPFATLGAPAPADPFAGLQRTKTGNDPFAAAPAPPGFGQPQPFSAPQPSPFPPPTRPTTSPPSLPRSLTPMVQPSVLPPANGPLGPEDTATEGMNVASLFGGAADPFGGLGAAGNVDESTTMGGPPPAPKTDEEQDPFAGLDADMGMGQNADVERVSLPTERPFNATPAPSQQARPPPPPRTAVPTNVPSPHPERAGADMQKLRRLEAVQRVREISWAAAQIAILSAFIVVAVVIARGGSVADLVAGDWRAALGGAKVSGDLAVEEPSVRRRSLPAGIDVVVVSGFVRNTSDKSVPGARVDVKFGDGPVASGWAWSSVDGIDVMHLKDAPEAGPLSLRPPTNGMLAPAERAPFVVVAPAPSEGLRASFEVHAVAPPPKDTIPLSPLPDETDAATPPAKAPKAPAKDTKSTAAPAAPSTTVAAKPGASPAAVKPAAVKPTAAKPAAVKPAAVKPAAEKPAAAKAP